MSEFNTFQRFQKEISEFEDLQQVEFISQISLSIKARLEEEIKALEEQLAYKKKALEKLNN